MTREVHLSEYGADCFDVSGVDRGDVQRAYAAGRWFPLYFNDQHIGHVMIDYSRGSTEVSIRVLKGNTLEVRPDPENLAIWKRLQALEETEPLDSEAYDELLEQLEEHDEMLQKKYEAM